MSNNRSFPVSIHLMTMPKPSHSNLYLAIEFTCSRIVFSGRADFLHRHFLCLDAAR